MIEIIEKSCEWEDHHRMRQNYRWCASDRGTQSIVPKVTSPIRMACYPLQDWQAGLMKPLLLTVGATAGHWDVGPAVSAQSCQLRTGAYELAAFRRGPSQAQPGTGACAEQVWQDAVKDGEERSTGSLSTNARIKCSMHDTANNPALRLSMMSTAQQAISLPISEH